MSSKFSALKLFLVNCVFALLVSGCVMSNEVPMSPGQKPVQDQAIGAYGRGVEYLGQSRYLLAREQFAEAASLAVTRDLQEDALAGMQKADAILENRRKYHE